MAGPAPALDPLRDRAVRLARYLHDLVDLRWKKTRDCSQYDELLWLADVPKGTGYSCSAWPESTDTEIWLSARKQPEPGAPDPPGDCLPWLDPNAWRGTSHEPMLRDVCARPEAEGGGFLYLRDFPKLQEAWLQYLITSWQPWATRHREWEAGQKIYDHLLVLYRKQRRMAEEFELLLGQGLLSWITPSDQRVRRHLIVSRARLEFDTEAGLISVLADQDGAGTHIEWDMLEPTEQPLPAQQEEIELHLRACEDDPWAPSVKSALERCLNAIDSRGAWSDSLRPPAAPSHSALVAFSPALILRRRTQRSQLQLLKKVSEQIEDGGDVPGAFFRLCTVTPTSRPGMVGAGEPPPPVPVLFPLASNAEQLKVVETLQCSPDVLVQGPPGTGKTWTIANLLCHLLASGKRVLVTSQTPRALKVLRDKLPQAIQPLCVNLLGDDAKGTRDLEASVAAIVREFHAWNGDDRARNIADLERRRESARADRQEAENRLREMREKETFVHTLPGGYQGTAEQIGRVLEEESVSFDWLADQVPVGTEAPLSPESLAALLGLIRKFPAERVSEVALHRRSPSALPDPDRFAASVLRERKLRKLCDPESGRLQSGRPGHLQRLTADSRTALRAATNDLLAHIKAHESSGGWRATAVQQALTDSTPSWDALRRRTDELARELEPDAAWCDGRQLSIPPGCSRAQLRADLGSLRHHLRNGGRLGVWRLRPEPVRRGLYILRSVLLDGLPVRDVRSLDELDRYLSAGERTESARQLWSEIGPLPTSPLLAATHAELRARAASLATILDGTPPLLDAYRARLGKVSKLAPPLNAEGLAELLADIDAVDRQVFLNQVSNELAALAANCRRPSGNCLEHPAMAQLRQAIGARDAVAYRTAWEELATLEEDAIELKSRDELLAALGGPAPLLAAKLRSSPDLLDWDKHLLEWLAAWCWARARFWLREFSAQDPEDLQQRVAAAEDRVRNITADLATAKAWRACFARICDPDAPVDYLQYLQAWTQEIRLLGKGTGKHAWLHRRNARNYLAQCRPAVPVWIMPFYRIAESVDPAPGIFDVAIVDEASQSGLETLVLYYLSKQVLVVGDDRQISPEDVGLDQGQVQSLLQRHLADFELRDTFAVGHSLFDHAALRAPGRIVLREHFRCMPEIIRFSSSLSYPDAPLLPLRRYAAQRLPPLQSRYIASGFRESKGQTATNPPEAEAMVEAIVQCCADPAYDGRSMGVISLQGEAQADLVDRLLRNRLAAREIERREIVCGDAYAFQGTERDVIFLSLVAATNERFQALTTENAKRRFNVAASRARDQCWLFHSVTLNDLSPDDLRRSLLSHYLHPALANRDEIDWSRCESDFERDVGRLIAGRGFHLIPQFEPFGPGGYRIDFIVDAGSNRLAVECDGDHWHGPDQYEKDMFRQRQLERAGWRFWRVRASTFYRDRAAAMLSLWDELVESEPPLESSPSRPSDAQRPPTASEPIPGPELNPARLPISDLDSPQLARALRDSLRFGPLTRDQLLRTACTHLGFSRLGKLVRKRLNLQIGAELRAGRLTRQGDTILLSGDPPSSD